MSLKLEEILLVCLNEASGGSTMQEHWMTQDILHEGDVSLDATDLVQHREADMWSGQQLCLMLHTLAFDYTVVLHV